MMVPRLTRGLAWLRRHEITPLLVLVLVAGSILVFGELAGEVVEGDTNAFDRALLLALRNPADITDPLGPPTVEEMARDFTALGGLGVLSFVTLSVAGYLYLLRKYRTMLFVLLAVGGGALLSILLKEGFGRPRPDLVPHGAYVYTSSFPSGHSMLSAVTYLTLGTLLARIQPGRRLKAYLLGLAMLLTFVIGVSRVYLGVHWPTDVLGGWTAGAAWAALCWLVARWLQRRGQIERTASPALEAQDEKLEPLDAPENGAKS
ncbi:MAG: phosphatase PAP2 family protein [Chloroflexi bacterium]|nr:phosphatase PAP2 family protein [Chloroflexota bacterium]